MTLVQKVNLAVTKINEQVCLLRSMPLLTPGMCDSAMERLHVMDTPFLGSYAHLYCVGSFALLGYCPRKRRGDLLSGRLTVVETSKCRAHLDVLPLIRGY